MSKPVSAPALHEASPYARHIPALDGIRGLAVLGVAASHLFPGTPKSLLTTIIGRILSFGSVGVVLFFVLSGFLITGILHDSLGEAYFFRKFYARRALRIFPLYYGVLAVYALMAIVFGLQFHRELLSFSFYLQNTYMIAIPIYTYQGPTALPLPHFWSLAVEEQFYLVWPLLVFLVRRRDGLLGLCAASFILCPLLRLTMLLNGEVYHAVQGNTLYNADLLLAGAALAFLLRGSMQTHDRTLRAGPWLLIVGLAVPIVLESVGAGTAVSVAIDGTAYAAAFFGLIACSLRSGYTRRLFNIQPLRLLGKYSYGIYVFHVILFAYLQQPIKTAVSMYITQSKGAGVFIAGTLCFALTLIVAFLSYRLYESRFLRLKRFFKYDSAHSARE